MIGLFKKDVADKPAVKFFSKMPYIKSRLSDNLEKVLFFYQRSGRAVKSNHILVRLIESIASPMGNSLERYLDLVEDSAWSVGNGLGIGSPIYAPKMKLGGHFYKNGTGELLFLTSSDYNDLPHWSEVSPIKVLYHSRTDIDFSLLEQDKLTDGYTAISIDPVLLMYMYRGWFKSKREQEDGTVLGTRHFVAQWVLPTMIKSHLEVSWLNRIRHARWSIPIDDIEARGPIALPSSTTYLEDTLDDVIDLLLKRSIKLDVMLSTIPSLFNENADKVLEEDALVPTRNTNAFLTAANIPWLNMLLSLDELHPGNVNSHYRTNINAILKKVKSERLMAILGSNPVVSLVEQEIEALEGYYRRS